MTTLQFLDGSGSGFYKNSNLLLGFCGILSQINFARTYIYNGQERERAANLPLIKVVLSTKLS